MLIFIGPGILTCAASTTGPVIINHLCTKIQRVPEYWIDIAKAQFKISYGHTSHGSQIVSGMTVLMNQDTLYAFNQNGTGGALSLHDYEPAGDLGNPDRTTWAQRTRDLLNTPGCDRNLIMWSWCGQADTTEANINIYLNLMNQLELDFPDVTFIYMTGHLNGTGELGDLNLRNNQIRDYCRQNGKILFDFADIESYDPDGNYFLDKGANDKCYYYDGGTLKNWAIEWCNSHPGECPSCSCAYSESLNCDLKGRAFWWMLARLAGWKSSDPIFGGHDFNNNGSSNVAVWRPITGTWYIKDYLAVSWGLPGDFPVSGYYDTDSKADIAVWRPSNGYWYIKDQTYVQWGISEDIPVPGDYNGDGKTDIAVYRPSNGYWYIKDQAAEQWGMSTDIPVPGDYDGDNSTDIAVYRPSNGTWYLKGLIYIQWGVRDDLPIPGDYNGDGITDIAVYRPSNGYWFVFGQFNVQWGLKSDIPLVR